MEFTNSRQAAARKKPSEELIVSWIAAAWNDIPTEMVESVILSQIWDNKQSGWIRRRSCV